MKILQEMTAVRLLQLKAIKFQPKNPFVLANGGTAPMYCDDRKVLSYPKMRDFIRLELARVIGEMYPDADVIAGIAMNAIAHGVLVAEQLSLPFVYVHPTPKDHGLENQIEGDLRPRQSVVIVENQVNTGENCLKVIEAIRNNGCKVLGIVTIFDYEFPNAHKHLRDVDVDLTALTNLEAVLRHAQAMNIIDEQQKLTIEEWQKNPDQYETKE